MKLRKLMLAGGAIAALASVPAQGAVVDNPQFRVLGLVIVWGADGADNTPVVSDFIIDTATGTGADTDLITQDVHTVVTGSLTPTPDAVATDATPFDVTNSSLGPSASTDTNSDGVLDASDGGFSGFFIDQTTDVELASNAQTSSFFVASNTDFVINGAASEISPDPLDDYDLNDITWTMSVTPTGNNGGAFAFGANAQDPNGTLGSQQDLGDFNGTAVYTASRRTAATPGSIAQQSVRFDVTYALAPLAGLADDPLTPADESLTRVSGYDLSQGAGAVEANVTYTIFVP
ncbi:MAG: hypothetical protein AAF583_07910 [Pseudomonadota bacterium]